MISIATITIKTTKPRAVAAFWRDLLGYEVAPNPTASHADIGQTGQEGWVVLADPAGNLFCVLEGRAAHAARMTGRTPTPTPVCGHDEG